jgi:hypothetical protein
MRIEWYTKTKNEKQKDLKSTFITTAAEWIVYAIFALIAAGMNQLSFTLFFLWLSTICLWAAFECDKRIKQSPRLKW